MDAQQFCDELAAALNALLVWIDRADRTHCLREWQRDAKVALSVVERIARPEVLVYPAYYDGIRDWSAVLERVRNAARAAQPDRIEPLLVTKSILASYTIMALNESVNLFRRCAAFMRVPDADVSMSSPESSATTAANAPPEQNSPEGGIASLTDDERKVIQALWDLKATSESGKMSSTLISKKAKLPLPKTKHILARLQNFGLVESKQLGQSGGRWLTPLGSRMVQEWF